MAQTKFDYVIFWDIVGKWDEKISGWVSRRFACVRTIVVAVTKAFQTQTQYQLWIVAPDKNNWIILNGVWCYENVRCSFNYASTRLGLT